MIKINLLLHMSAAALYFVTTSDCKLGKIGAISEYYTIK